MSFVSPRPHCSPRRRQDHLQWLLESTAGSRQSLASLKASETEKIKAKIKLLSSRGVLDKYFDSNVCRNCVHVLSYSGVNAALFSDIFPQSNYALHIMVTLGAMLHNVLVVGVMPQLAICMTPTTRILYFLCFSYQFSQLLFLKRKEFWKFLSYDYNVQICKCQVLFSFSDKHSLEQDNLT